jgi:tRNA threonylcarbamoyladenosine biosynthesis protein TsaB
MLVLGIDTSGKSGGITLAQGDDQSFRVLETDAIAGGTFSAQLVPTLAALLASHSFAVQDIGGFAVASGPGSFTGLRVGLSAVKGLAEALGKPIAAVSILEALATLSPQPGCVAVALDAGRKEVFWGSYEVSVEGAMRISEELLSQAEFLERLSNGNLQNVITSDPSLVAIADATRAKARLQLINREGSELVARVGLRKLLAGDTVSVEALDANYIRRSDAELFGLGSVKGNR